MQVPYILKAQAHQPNCVMESMQHFIFSFKIKLRFQNQYHFLRTLAQLQLYSVIFQFRLRFHPSYSNKLDKVSVTLVSSKIFSSLIPDGYKLNVRYFSEPEIKEISFFLLELVFLCTTSTQMLQIQKSVNKGNIDFNNCVLFRSWE